ncbi:hypothetical protein K431DRAFT_287360 [Polychaeton citri CBS 116435]|uniref:ZZ-type domain-containing protein n=1 Tax=Polychaeton citri CBS 116435 TaxID=1314669 RepID=A0A9P4Q5Y2_9PEZI|nr:hypothetical protein K431DRAFT_287360 [Polychaeton citri CBS 116435]
MAMPQSSTSVPQDTLITVKVTVNDSLKKLKLPLRDLTAAVLLDKLRHCLSIKPEETVVFERFSDSAGGYVVLDANNPQVFKTLMRAAKAKLKLRLKATVTSGVSQSAQEAQEAVESEKPQAEQPTIVRSPVYFPAPRDSVAMDCRTVGHNIFKFREARAAQQNPGSGEAPVPNQSTTTKADFLQSLARAAPQHSLPHSLPVRVRECAPAASVCQATPCTWTVYCNECDDAMEDAHFHCGICDGGDFDLCVKCVEDGKLCHGDDHWLVKRFIQDGKVVHSTTTRVGRKVPEKSAATEEKEVSHDIPGAFQDETKTLAEETRGPTRTCNCCVVILPEHSFVTCTDCDDYDLCIDCFTDDKHGHHPGHAFDRATEKTVLPAAAGTMLAAGRGVRHHAICDGCDKNILGVRHKCLNCPDWDYCNECVQDAKTTHPRHRFAALYTPINVWDGSAQRHYGIFCDGPLCPSKQSYIRGIRYKCAVCNDTDFCASCEALPTHHHNRTHPLIKFATPVRHASIQTSCENPRGSTRTLGDRSASPPAGPAASQATPACIATPVQTMADIKPSEAQVNAPAVTVTKSEQPAGARVAIKREDDVAPALLNAQFLKDAIPDGTVVKPNDVLVQVWTLKNPGPYAWPAGCSVRYVGGDNMLNIDNTRIASAAEVAEATESNVIGRGVGVGEEVAFKILLKAPARAGKCISYWRLKAADGTPFGHRLWCDVQVQAMPVPVAMAPAFQPPTFHAGADPLGQMKMKAAFNENMQQQQDQRLLNQLQAQCERIKQPHMSQPSFAASAGNPDIASRVALMREAQQARREHLMAQFNAQREQSNAQEMSRPAMPFFPVINTTDQQKGNQMSYASADIEKSRKEAAKLRAEVLKAKILRAREIQAKAAEAEAEKTVSQGQVPQLQQTSEAETSSAAVDDSIKKEESPVEAGMERSQMIFPKLEKESPSSSTYASATSSTDGSKAKAAYVENEDGEVEHSAQPEPSIASPVMERDDFEDLTDDLEVCSVHGDDIDSDGFLTDEEYDILDASDRETVASH